MILLVVPMLIMDFFLPAAFWAVYFPVFMILFCITLGIHGLKIRGILDKNKIYLGAGDLLGIPLVLSICYAAHPFVGMTAFTATYAALLPVFLKAQQRRLLPWLVPPAAVALLASILTPLVV